MQETGFIILAKGDLTNKTQITVSKGTPAYCRLTFSKFPNNKAVSRIRESSTFICLTIKSVKSSNGTRCVPFS